MPRALTLWIAEYGDPNEDCNYEWSEWREVERNLYEHWQPFLRQDAHQIARNLRSMYPCSFVAVRPTELGKPRPLNPAL